MILLAILSALIILVGCFYLFRRIQICVYNYVEISKIPGPPTDGFFFGNMTYFKTTPEKIFRRLREARNKFYPIYKVHALHKVGVNILTPEDSELILSNQAHNEKAMIYQMLHYWLSEGLLTSNGNKWQMRRKILTPAFHFNILQEFVQVFSEESEELVETLKKESKKSSVDIMPHVTQFTLKTIAETAMGAKLNFQAQKDCVYKQAIIDVGKILLYRILHPWFVLKLINIFSPWYLQERKIVSVLHTFTKEVIRTRENNFSESIELRKEEHDVYKGKKRLAMLDLLLSVKKEEGIIDNKGVQEEVDTFMFEGHDTTAISLSLTLMLIASHKDVQTLIVQELQEVLGDLRKKSTYTDLQNMKYLERCIKESLRLYPSVYFIARTLGEDVTTHSGYLLPKETIAAIHIYDIHHDPNIYRDPEKFDPDRFLPENVQKRHPFAYLPFSAGSRNCIGQKFAILELKTAIAAILANFELEPVDTSETVVLCADIVLRTKEGVKIKLIPRTVMGSKEFNKRK